MTQYLKGIGALVIAFVIVAVAAKYFGLPHKSMASTASLGLKPIDISQIHQNSKTLPFEKFHDMTFVFSERD